MYAAKYLQIPSIGLWTFAGPGSMVGIVDMFLMQTGLEAPEILRQVETFEPMLESIKRFKENYGFLTEIQLHLLAQSIHIDLSSSFFSMFWRLAAAGRC